jgi:adenine/guanine/hypoxanthine permease
MRWFVRGDVDGFFGLALDNLVQLLLIASLWKGVLGFPDELLYGRVLPGVAVSLLVGNLFYAWQARRLALRTGRSDVCALPYGLNTVTIIAYTFLVMLPAKLRATNELHLSPEEASVFAWQAGLMACFYCGFIEFVGSFIAGPVRRATPRAALLSTLAAIALGFIALGFFFQAFAHPIVGLTTFGLVLMVYFARVRFKGGVPGGLVAVAVGTALAWATGLVKGGPPETPLRWLPPVPVADDLFAALSGDHLGMYLTVVVPMALFNLVGSLQNIESAEAAGDAYPTAPSLAVNGVGSMAAALFGSCFPTTIYIGHPGWKAMGARAGSSVLHGLFFTVVCLTGVLSFLAWAVPIDAGMAIVLWIGIVITAQAFQATPREHAPAVVVGLLPGVAAWGVLMAKTALRAGDVPFSEKLVPAFQGAGTWIEGALALEQGFIFTSIVWSAVTVALIERRFGLAALWCAIAAALSFTSIMHGYEWVGGDTVGTLSLAWSDRKAGFVFGYLIMGACFLVARWVTEPYEGESH